MVKYTEKSISEELAKLDMTYLSGYIDTNKKFNVMCSCGRIYSTLFHSIKYGSKCGCKKLASTEDYISSTAAEYGITYVSGYINAKEKFNAICICGRLYKAYLGKIRQGFRCGHCAEENMRQVFKQYGCDIIEYVNVKNILYRCHCGNEHRTTFINFENGKKNCPACRVNWNHNPNIPTHKRENLSSWKKQVLRRDGFLCKNCGSDDNLCTHHIESYSIAIDLRNDPDNGVTLCVDCHKALHSKFGHNVGLKNLQAMFESRATI
jgi:hypothetical protein